MVKAFERISAKEFLQRQAAGDFDSVDIMGKSDKKPKRSKMRNKITVIDGIRFDSQLEAAYYLYLEYQKKLGVVSHYNRQVPYDCGGLVTYKLDFLVFKTDESIDHVDVKGQRLPEYKNKKKQVESRYPIKILEVTDKDIPDSFITSARELNELNQPRT